MKRIFFIFPLMTLLVLSGFALPGRDADTANIPTYSYLVCLYQPEPPDRNDPIIPALEKLIGAKLDIWWTPNNAYNNRVNLCISSNEMPNAFNPRPVIFENDVFVTAAKNNMFWELSDALAKSKYLSAMLPEKQTVEYAKTDGKLYMIPKLGNPGREGVSWRKDWAEKLGLGRINNWNDFINMAEAFASRDPDGNGKNDTFAYMLSALSNPMAATLSGLTAFNGAPNGFDIQNGKLVPVYLTEYYFNVLRLLRDWYAKGWINQDFATIQSAKVNEMHGDSRAGLLVGNVDAGGLMNLVTVKQAQDPSIGYLDLWDFNEIIDPEGKTHRNGGTGFFFGIAFPKSSNKTQADFDRIFNAFDLMASEEGKILRWFGVEGVTFEVQNGTAHYLVDQSVINTNVANMEQVFPTASFFMSKPVTIKEILSPEQAKMNEFFEKAIGNQIYSPVLGVISPTAIARGNELDRILADAATQYIMGVITEAQLREEQNRWRNSGGQAIIDEYTNGWLARNAN